MLGACTGTDAHTVGIDAILNMKGYAGDYGLERYPWFEAHNLGSQVQNDELIRKAKERSADAILVSQVVTQRDVHKDNARQFIEAAKARGAARQDVCCCSAGRASTTSSRSSSASTPASARAPSRPTSRTSSSTQLLQAAGQGARGMHYEGEPRERVAHAAAHEQPRRPLRRQPGRRRAHARRSSATWPPSCSSATTATRGCSAPTTAWSSWRRCYAGDFIEVEGEIVRRSARPAGKMRFEARKVIRPLGPRVLDSAAEVLAPAHRGLPRDAAPASVPHRPSSGRAR